MSWDSFVWFALAASLFWISGAIVSVISKRRLPAAVLAGCGSAIFMTFIVGVWISLGRPPLRTMGETRLWFSLFLSLIGLVVYLRWRYRWVLPFGCLMAVMFAGINIFKPEIHTEELMPALRSPWFVPHVIVYMFSYAVMAIATILALRNGIAPPTINLDTPDPECDLDYTPNKAVKADLTIGISDSLGFGGHDACVAFRKYTE